MFWLILSILLLGVLTAIGVNLSDKLSHRDPAAAEDPIQVGADCSTCTGENSKCEQECMLEAAVKEIEYFDDEELDAFRGRPSDAYTDEEAETFRQILYTMRPEEVAAWNRSLVLRGVELPNQVKDEAMMLMNDER